MDRKYDVHGEKNKPVNTGEAMGKYFVMSVRFNKCSALDFGLVPKDAGTAAVILENYADELLGQCEAMMDDPLRKKEFRRSAEVFRLEEPLNRCSVAQKTSEQIKSNHTRWKKIAQAAGKIR